MESVSNVCETVFADKDCSGKDALSMVPTRFTKEYFKRASIPDIVVSWTIPRLYEALSKAAHATNNPEYEDELATVMTYLVAAIEEVGEGDPLTCCAKVMAFGAEKYARNNWKKGFRWSLMIDAALRHLRRIIVNAEFLDEESGEHHLSHVCFCVAMLLEMYYKGYGENDLYTVEP